MRGRLVLTRVAKCPRTRRVYDCGNGEFDGENLFLDVSIEEGEKKELQAERVN
jgi:hypothetical protein